jgi:hypothetical protein
LGELKVTKPPAWIVVEDGLNDWAEKLSSDIFQPLTLTALEPLLYSSTVSLFDEVTSLIRTFW